ncbi:hypothetical protein I316_01324 [Kwoniella heveanensis BCC8398]|uniref:BZIP domain-containing protein n=1 Tax=Kwoniella heveanensis BCC8398 TaxID=1296120 RepID=A0A1B9H0B7_9TREE|nr:hypothetical protein I316_01324 [Kwoniella heveanensis BCC8398]
MNLHSLADAALADAKTAGRSQIILPPISALMPPSTSGSRMHTTMGVPASGSRFPSTFAPSTAPTPRASVFPPSADVPDQPTVVSGWSPSNTQPQRHHRQANERYVEAGPSNPRLAPITPSGAGVANAVGRAKKGSKQGARSSLPTSISSAIPLEYNVRPYKRVAPTASSSAASSSAAGRPVRTQPTRAARLNHPLKDLKLDKIYPERSPQVWHEDAQRLLRPPRNLAPTSAGRASPLNKHSAAQALLPPTDQQVKRKRVHPPIAPWNELHQLPQMPLEDPYLPQTQEGNGAMRPGLNRPHSSSSYSGPSWDPMYSHLAQPPRAFGSPSVDSHPPRHTLVSPPHQVSPEAIARPMKRSLSAHQDGDSTRMERRTRVPTSEPRSPQLLNRGGEDRWGGSPRGRIGEGRHGTNGNGSREGNGDGKGLPTTVTASVTGRFNLPAPVLPPPISPAAGVNLPSSTFFSRTITPSLSLSALTSAPSLPEVPKPNEIDRRASIPSLVSGDSVLLAQRHDQDISKQLSTYNDSSFDVSGETSVGMGNQSLSQEVEAPELELDQSSYSESSFEPISDVEMVGDPNDEQEGGDSDADSDDGPAHTASQDNRGVRLRLRIPTVNRDAQYTSGAAVSSSPSHQARSSSTDRSLMGVKDEPVDSPLTTTPSPAKPKRARRNATGSKSAGRSGRESTRSKGNGGALGVSTGSASASASSWQKTQRRNGERRREQNAVAQKKFRWKKKQIAAQMEADLESANALAASLKKENEEKDRLVSKLRGQLSDLKRKLEKLEA